MTDEATSLRTRSRMPSPTRRDLVSVLFRQRRPVFWSFAAALFMFLAYGIVSHSYTSEMKILLRRGRIDLPMSAEPSTLPLRYEVSEEELNSEAEFLRDADTARRVVLATHLDAHVGWRPWRATPEGQTQLATRLLLRRLQVEPIRKTRLLKVSYESSDPVRAAEVLKSLAAVYMEKHLAAHRPSGEFGFFEEQAGHARERLAVQERGLLSLNDRGVVEPALQRDLALQKGAEAESSYKQLMVSIAEKQARLEELGKEIASYPERTILQVRSGDNLQLLEKLKSTLLTLELRRTELATRFQPEYRLVREIDQQIQQTKETIAAESLRPVREETSSQNAQHEWAVSELQQTQVEVEGLRTRAAGLATLAGEYGALSRQLGRDTLTHADFLREAKKAEESYGLLSKKLEEARIGDALDDRQVLNATVIQQPVVPAVPKRSPLSLAILGVLVAAGFSTGIAFAADALDPTFRLPEEVIKYLDAPVLASLPVEAQFWRGGGST